jgi:inner membrane protein
MDSLTQIVLGAAVGEAALGKKVGNRAMVWGAIAGTLPDLDVIANGFMTPIDALAFHRGPTHSALYLSIFSLILGWLVHRLYQQKWHKWVGLSAWSISVLLLSISILWLGKWSISSILISLSLLGLGGFTVRKKYFNIHYDSPVASTRQWQWMFFLVLLTHPILDCFTTYGTQILLPFSSQRVAFNNIAVADPLYTLPFLLFLLTAAFYHRNNHQRAKWNNIGLIVSSLYMIFTIVNKTRINTIFENSLIKENIAYSRYMTTPTILNNILWSGIAESDSVYYYGTYSFFDKEKFFKINTLPKNRSVVGDAILTDKTLKTLTWFSDDYYQIKRKSQDSLEYYDLRFGTFKMKSTDPEQFVFKFNLIEKPEGHFILKDQGDRPRDANFAEAFAALWDRIMGRT